MPWLILGIGVVVGLVLIFRGLAALNPRRAAQALGTTLVLATGGVAAYFILSRGLGAVLMALAFMLPMFLRWRAAGRFFRNARGPQPGQSSDVETRFLRMNLDHDSGTLDGLVLDGRHRGHRLSEMTPPDLLNLLRECRIEDPDSATVLEAYLDRMHGAAWRAEDAGGAYAGKNGGAASNGPMTREEAFEILGLAPGATTEEIKQAHHRLMKKIHPDQGGSNYLAAKINQAKAMLIGD